MILPDVTTVVYEEVRHLPVLPCHANEDEDCPAKMAHPEITIFVVPREEGIPHAHVIECLSSGGIIVYFELHASSNEPLHCNEASDRECHDEEEEQEDCQETERQVLPRPAPTGKASCSDCGRMRREARPVGAYRKYNVSVRVVPSGRSCTRVVATSPVKSNPPWADDEQWRNCMHCLTTTE